MKICGVTQLVSRTFSLDKEDLLYLKNLYESLPERQIARDYNLFNLIRKDVEGVNTKEFNKIREKLKSVSKSTEITHYFLMYGVNSFSSLHIDSPHRVTATAITLIDKSDDLVGGEIILQNKLKMIKRGTISPSDKELLDKKKEGVPLLEKVNVIRTVRHAVGETVWYPAQMMHGVSEVEQGYRLVLISWYKDNEKDQIHKEAV